MEHKILFILHEKEGSKPAPDISEIMQGAATLILYSEKEDHRNIPVQVRNTRMEEMIVSDYTQKKSLDGLRFSGLNKFLEWVADEPFEIVCRIRSNGTPITHELITEFIEAFASSRKPYGIISTWNSFLPGLLVEAWHNNDLKRYIQSNNVQIFPDGHLQFPERSFDYELGHKEWQFYYDNHYETLFKFPHTLQIELASVCNNKCLKCIFHSGRSPLYDPVTCSKPFIGIGLFKKIIDEFSTFQTPNGQVAALNYRGESLLHPNFFEMVAYTRKKRIRAVFNTNGRLMTPEVSKKLLDSDLTAISFSVDSLVPEMYQKLQGGDLETILKNIEFLIEEKDRRGLNRPILSSIHVLSSENRTELEKILKYFLKRFNLVSYSFYQDIMDRRVSAPHTFFNPVKRIPCSHLWEVMTILSSGEVIRCGYDINHEDILGDLNKESIEDIWNSQKVIRYRKEMCAGNFEKVKICDTCSRWKATQKKMEIRDGLFVTTQWEGRTLQKIGAAYSDSTISELCANIPKTIPLN